MRHTRDLVDPIDIEAAVDGATALRVADALLAGKVGRHRAVLDRWLAGSTAEAAGEAEGYSKARGRQLVAALALETRLALRTPREVAAERAVTEAARRCAAGRRRVVTRRRGPAKPRRGRAPSHRRPKKIRRRPTARATCRPPKAPPKVKVGAWTPTGSGTKASNAAGYTIDISEACQALEVTGLKLARWRRAKVGPSFYQTLAGDIFYHPAGIELARADMLAHRSRRAALTSGIVSSRQTLTKARGSSHNVRTPE